MKRCSKCGEEKPLESFGRCRRSKGGHLPRCKVCVNTEAKVNRDRRMQDPEYRTRVLEAQAAYDQAHREQRRDWTRRWRAQNPEAARKKSTEASRQLRERDPDYFRNWYRENADKERARSKRVMRDFRKNHPERERAIQRRYRANNLEAVRAREREKTYARREKQPFSPELAELMAALVQQPCAYCGAEGEITIDHIVPLARGGKHEAENLAPACLPCNCSKNSQLPEEWEGRLNAA